jgi:uncharacterized protein with HEPN domain
MTRSAHPHFALIRHALAQIERYTPVLKEHFLENQMAQDAILMRLQEIGENLSRIRNLDEESFSNSHAPGISLLACAISFPTDTTRSMQKKSGK